VRQSISVNRPIFYHNSYQIVECDLFQITLFSFFISYCVCIGLIFYKGMCTGFAVPLNMI
jgi:hypothetical protein